jgi:hypothetical protein
MKHRGAHYDTRTVFRGPGYAISTRREPLDMAVVQREMQIIRDDLHANAVRVVGSDLGRLTAAARVALDLDLEVCFSPAFFERPLEELASRLYTRPVIGRFFRPRVKGTFERDEALQALEIAATLDELERSGVAGALLSTFATPEAYTDDDPRYDVDMDSMSLVKALPDGRHGTAYPDMS